MKGRRFTALATLAIGCLVTGALPAQAAVPAFEPYQAYALGATAESVVIADINADGRRDIVVSTSTGDASGAFALAAFVQAADGTLVPPVYYDTLGRYSDEMGLAAGDLDGDGVDDIALATSSGVEIRHGGPKLLGPRSFIDAGPSRQVEIADLDGHGPNEVVSSGPYGVRSFWRNPTGADYWMGGVTTEVQTEIEVGDVTGDGFGDVVGFVGRTVRVYRQFPGDGFALPVSYQATVDYWPNGGGLAVGDLNADGLADVALSIAGNRPGALVNLFVQTETGELSGPSVYESYDIPEPLEIADLDGDGRGDLITLHGGWLRAGVWSLEYATFRETLYEIPYASHYDPKGLAVGDVDGDGVGDVVLADYNHGLVVLRSTPPPPDTVAPATTLTGGPVGTVRSTTATFSFIANEPARFVCTLDGGGATPCTSPVTYGNLSEGGHTFLVQAIDDAGNSDPSPAARSFRVDTRAPETSITGGPSGTIEATTATFGFGADEPATFRCSLDGAVAGSCSSPVTYSSLAEGNHEFRVWATDMVGNIDSTPAVRAFTVRRPSDLAVSITDNPDPVKSKSQLRYQVTVTNGGPADNTGVSVRHALPAQTSVVSVTPSRGSCTTGGSPAVVTCVVGPLANGTGATVDVVVRVDAKRGSTLASSAQVSGDRTDPAPANNSGTASTAVR